MKSVLAVAAAVTLGAIGAAGASENESGVKALNAAKVTLVDAIRTAETKSGGKAYDATLKAEEGDARYVVEVASEASIQRVTVDTQTGAVSKVEMLSEDLDQDGDGQ